MLDKSIYYPTSCILHKQAKIRSSSFGSEILAAADDDDLEVILKRPLSNIFPSRVLKYEIPVDSKPLFKTINILHKTYD